MNMYTKKNGPQFPAADYHSIRQEGAKNHRGASIGCGELYIGTYNVRSLMGEDKLDELEQELQSTKWHEKGPG